MEELCEIKAFIYKETEKEFKINNILCFGAGYVGVLTMSVLADNHRSININVYDSFSELIDKWNKSLFNLLTTDKVNSITNPLPIKEKNLELILSKVYNKNLYFKDKIDDKILLETDAIFICVNTPSYAFNNSKIKLEESLEDLEKEITRGIQLNLDNVNNTVLKICEIILNSNSYETIFKQRIIIQKSTVPISTLTFIRGVLINYFSQKENLEKLINIKSKTSDKKEFSIDEYVDTYFKLLNIPEFLAEGSAVQNLLFPDRVVIGSLKNKESQFASRTIANLYNKWVDQSKIITIDSNSSEITKLMSNAFLGQRIASINSVTELCEMYNADVNKLSEAIGMDSRIGKTYLKASMGFGGSCLKKDILSLVYIFASRNLEVQAKYWGQVILMNEYQRLRVAKLIKDSAITDKEESNRTVSLFGAAFKGNTNDIRGSNSIFLIAYLINNKIKINVFDPFVKKEEIENELKLYELNVNLEFEFNDYIKIYNENPYDAVKDNNTVIFCNNHSEWNDIDLKLLYKKMKNIENKFIFDLYDVFETEKMKKEGYKIFKIGVCSEI